MELVEQLKHVYSYNEIYELLYDGPVSFDDIKAHLMLDCHKPESTARSYITAIRGGNPGMIIVDEEAETMELNKEEILDFEENLQLLFDWNLYDKRFYEIKGLETDLSDAKYEIKNHKCMLVPIDEFNDLYERLKNCLENYESTHHLNKTGGWWSNY